MEAFDEFKKAGFKFFESAPYEFPDPKGLIDANIVGLKTKESVYGPVYSKKVVKYALEFISEKTGERAAENVENLDQLAELLLSIASKYPTPYCAIVYADVRVEVELQGEVGAATRIGEMGYWRRTFTGDPMEKGVDVERILTDMRKVAVDLKLSPKDFGYKVNSDGTTDLLLPNCYYKDACRRAFSENILRRMDGRGQCPVVSSLCQYLKMASGYDWDYDLLEFDKPHCLSKIYML